MQAGGASQQRTGSQQGGQQAGGQRMMGGQQSMGQQAGGMQSLLFPTATYLPEQVRVPVIQELNDLLADTTVLMTHAKYAHWNLKGMDFIGLHELFDETAETLEDHVDLIAERATALGGQALGTAGMAVSNCSIPPMQPDAITGIEYVELLAERLAVHDSNLHRAIELANEYGDDDTADMLNEISREVSQQLWFLEAHLQTQPTSSIPAGGGQGMGGQGMGGSQQMTDQQAGGGWQQAQQGWTQ